MYLILIYYNISKGLKHFHSFIYSFIITSAASPITTPYLIFYTLLLGVLLHLGLLKLIKIKRELKDLKEKYSFNYKTPTSSIYKANTIEG